MNRKDRIDWIDALKGFGIICVVLGHVVKGYMDAHAFRESTALLHAVYNVLYSFHMPLFMVVSGYLFDKAYVDGNRPDRLLKKKSLNRQTANLAVLYVLYSVLLGLSKIVFTGEVNHQVSLTDILMIWAKPIQLMWYLYVLLLLYVLFRIRFFRNGNAYLCLGLAALSLVSGYLPKVPWFQVNQLAYYAFFFCAGQWIDRILSEKKSLWAGSGLLILSLVLAVVYWNDKKYLNNIPVVNTLVAAGLVFGLLILFSKVKCFSGSRFFRVFGKHSLEIYLLHPYAATVCRSLFRKAGLSSMIPCVLLNTLISLLLPLAFSLLVKKTGCNDLFFRPYSFAANGAGIRKSLTKLKKNWFLFTELTKRDFKQKYKGTFLGMIWSVLSPLLQLLVLRIVFTELLGKNTPHFTTYLFSGLLVFNFFTESTKGSLKALSSNRSIILKIKAPKYLFLLSKNMASLINFAIILPIYFLFAALDGVTFHISFLALIYPILLLPVFCIGVGMILSALQVFFNDTSYFYDIVIILLRYLSAIFYDINRFPEDVQRYFLFNPVYAFIKYFRTVVLFGQIPPLTYHLLLLGYTLLAIAIGGFVYRKNNRRFAYYL